MDHLHVRPRHARLIEPMQGQGVLLDSKSSRTQKRALTPVASKLRDQQSATNRAGHLQATTKLRQTHEPFVKSLHIEPSLQRYLNKFGNNPVSNGSAGGANRLGKIRRRLNRDGDHQGMVNAIAQLHKSPPFRELNIWPVTRDWLRAHSNFPGINIPD